MDKWKPKKLNKKEIARKIKMIRFVADRMDKGMQYNSTLVDLDYDEIMQLMEELYGDMDIENLAIDNLRRKKEVKDKVKAAEKNK